jgi:hypothetical protein
MRLLVLLLLWTVTSVTLLAVTLVNLVYYQHPPSIAKMNQAVAAKTNLLVVTIQPTVMITPPAQDIRIIALTRFLEDNRSPLKDFAEDIVYQADLNGIPYYLVPAIAMQESGGCKRIPEDSYNCWGFGIYGNKVIRFASYKEAITNVTKTVKEAYIKNGLTNATLVEDRWTPSSDGQWSSAVNYFIGKIKECELNIPAS